MTRLSEVDKQTHAYRAFGLNVDSDTELPGLKPIPSTPPDVVVRQGVQSPSCFSEGIALLNTEPQRVQVKFRDLFELEIDATRVGYQCLGEAGRFDVGHYLVDWALPLALFLGEGLALHGSAVRLPHGGAFIFCGHSGAGKSTLSLELSQRGYPKLADDIAGLRWSNGRIQVEPGVAHSKLLVDAVCRTGLSPDDCVPVAHKAGKFIVPTELWAGVEPLMGVVELVAASESDVRLEPVRGVEKFGVLDRHSVGTTLMQRAGLRRNHLVWLSRLVEIPLFRLTRPLGEDSMEHLVRELELVWQNPTFAAGSQSWNPG